MVCQQQVVATGMNHQRPHCFPRQHCCMALPAHRYAAAVSPQERHATQPNPHLRGSLRSVRGQRGRRSSHSPSATSEDAGGGSIKPNWYLRVAKSDVQTQ